MGWELWAGMPFMNVEARSSGLGLSFHCVGSRDGAQVRSLDGKHPYALSHLSTPSQLDINIDKAHSVPTFTVTPIHISVQALWVLANFFFFLACVLYTCGSFTFYIQCITHFKLITT